VFDSIKWAGAVEISGKTYENMEQARLALKGFSGDLCVVFTPKFTPRETTRDVASEREMRITVRYYMTAPPTATFDFHRRRNNGLPMPEKTMVGRVVEESRGMVKMELRSEITDKTWTGWVIKSAIINQEEL